MSLILCYKVKHGRPAKPSSGRFLKRAMEISILIACPFRQTTIPISLDFQNTPDDVKVHNSLVPLPGNLDRNAVGNLYNFWDGW